MEIIKTDTSTVGIPSPHERISYFISQDLNVGNSFSPIEATDLGSHRQTKLDEQYGHLTQPNALRGWFTISGAYCLRKWYMYL